MFGFTVMQGLYNFDFLRITFLSPSNIVNVWERYIDRKRRLVDTTILLQSLRAKTSSKYNVLKMALFITYVDVVCGMRCVLSKTGVQATLEALFQYKVRDANYHTQMNISTYKSSKLVRGFEAWQGSKGKVCF